MKYFTDLSSLRSWTAHQADGEDGSLDRANIPLQVRPNVGEREQFKILVCHDFKGSYLPYEDSQGIFSKETVYTLEYLHLITTFVYFSHHRVSIPPAPWINLMHKNGVKTLGTFLVEPGNTSGFDDLLEKDYNGRFIFVERLADIAQYYGFDGYLLNFESHFPDEKFSLQTVISWIDELRKACESRLAGGEVVWYDSLSLYNRVSYANGLSPLNAPFFDVSSALFTNYRWNPLNQLLMTAALSKSMNRNGDVYMGIDVHGRGTFGGGGWGVGTALSVVKQAELSAAIFAPGWTYENFEGKDFHLRERKFWISSEAIEPETESKPVADFAIIQEAGTNSFFYTNFSRGFGKKWYLASREISSKPWIHLAAQSLLPSYYPTETDRLTWSLDDSMPYQGGQCLQINYIPTQDSPFVYCNLYKLCIDYKPSTRLSFSYIPFSKYSGRINIYINLKRFNDVIERHEIALQPSQAENAWITKSILLDIGRAEDEMFNMKIVEFGISLAARTKNPEPLEGGTVLKLGHISFSNYEQRTLPAISKVSTNERQNGTVSLSWSLDYTGMTKEELAMQCAQSKDGITGEYEHFVVYKGLGECLGIAYCMEFLTVSDTAAGAVYRVDGVAFDGTIVKGAWF